MNQTPRRLLGDVADCAEILNLGERTVYNIIRDDPTFPKPIEVRPGMRQRFLDEVIEWAKNRPRVTVVSEPSQLAAKRGPRTVKRRKQAARAGA